MGGRALNSASMPWYRPVLRTAEPDRDSEGWLRGLRSGVRTVGLAS